MKEYNRRPAWTQEIFLLLIVGTLFTIPLFIIDFPVDLKSVWGIYLGFSGFLLTITIIDMIRLFIGEYRENLLLKGKIKGTQTTGRFVFSKVKVSGSGGTHSHINFSYIDENGVERNRQSYRLYRNYEVAYLKDLDNIEVVCNGKIAVIIEDLSIEKINEFYCSRKESFGAGEE